MNILGIDPAASGPAGLAIVDFYHSEPRIMYADVVVFPRGTWDERFGRLQDAIARLRHCDVIACESAYLGKNAQTYGRLCELLGAARHLAHFYDIYFVAVTETQQRGELATIPRPLLERATAHIDPKLREHAIDAVAIAWFTSGVVKERRFLATSAAASHR